MDRLLAPTRPTTLRHRSWRRLAVLLLLVVAVAACGGGGGDDAEESSSGGEDAFCEALRDLADQIPAEPDPDRSTEGDLELFQAAADAAPGDAVPVFEAFAAAIEGLENPTDPPDESWTSVELETSRAIAIDVAEDCGVELAILEESTVDAGLLALVVVDGPGDGAGGGAGDDPEAVCADFADEVASLDSDLAADSALRTAAGGLDASDPEQADLAAAMEDEADAIEALVQAAADALGVPVAEVSLLVTESAVSAYPASEGLTGIVDVAGGLDLYEDVVDAGEARRDAAAAAGLDECATTVDPVDEGSGS